MHTLASPVNLRPCIDRTPIPPILAYMELSETPQTDKLTLVQHLDEILNVMKKTGRKIRLLFERKVRKGLKFTKVSRKLES